MAYRFADLARHWIRDVETMTSTVAILRPPAALLAGFEPDLAAALRFRASALAAEGWYGDALIDIEDALRICYRARIFRHTTADVQLAWLLSLRAQVLRCSGRELEAVDDARQALELCRRRMPRAPHRFGPALLDILDELARSLNETGDPAQALVFGEELVHLLRRLIPHRPRYDSSLAAALHQLGVYHSAAGELTAALHATNESLQLYLRLDGKHPETYALQVDLATFNRNLFLDRLHPQI